MNKRYLFIFLASHLLLLFSIVFAYNDSAKENSTSNKTLVQAFETFYTK